MARTYQKRRRAELEAETRRRITEAMVELHGSIGPQRTTIQAVAQRASVQRATVYRHFPDEPSMYAACSAHWVAQNPLPDPTAWATVAEPGQRIRTALGDLYRFYARNEGMLSNIFRDEPLVDAMRPAMQQIRQYLTTVRDVIVGDWDGTDSDLRFVRAAAGHAVSFSTWSSLTQEHGVSQDVAVSLMAGMIQHATRDDADLPPREGA